MSSVLAILILLLLFGSGQGYYSYGWNVIEGVVVLGLIVLLSTGRL